MHRSHGERIKLRKQCFNVLKARDNRFYSNTHNERHRNESVYPESQYNDDITRRMKVDILDLTVPITQKF